MALFNRSKKVDAPKPIGEAPQTMTGISHSRAHLLSAPRITEKATVQQGMSVYTFDVSLNATKRDIIGAVRDIYKVMPIKVAMLRIPHKERRSMKTGKRGMTGGGKKAYVYLKRGETITLS